VTTRHLPLVALLLAGCSVGPAYQRPTAPAPEAFRYADVKESESIADLPWWQLFRDPTLEGLIREALEKNQDLALAAARVQESQAVARGAAGPLWPQVGVVANGSYGQASKKNYPGATAQASFGLDAAVSWELDLWGRVRSARDQAEAISIATEEDRRAVVLSLVSGVAQAYLELRALDLQLEVARTNGALRKGTLDLFEARATGGVASELEVEQARADYAVTSAAEPSTERLIALKEHELCVLLGRLPGPIDRGLELVETPVPPELPAGVPATLLERRPDLRSAEQVAMAATAGARVATAERFPRLSLAGVLGLGSPSLSSLFTGDALMWSVGGGLLAPIFQGGTLKANQDAAYARMDQAAAGWRQAVLQALREVSDAAVSVKKYTAVRTQNEIEVKSTSNAARLAMLRYEGGVSSYLEVLDAQRRQFDSANNLVASRRNELVSVVQLYKSLGGGWQEAPATTATPAKSGPAPAPQPAR
jgi:outer membrane protein, multidrug efflux system